MSEEERKLREQRRKIIQDINDYLNDQNENHGLAPLSNEDEEIVDEDEMADPTNVLKHGKEEEKVNEDEETVESPPKKKANLLFPMMQSGVFIPPSVARSAINDALE